MKKLFNIILLLFPISLFSQESKAYLLLDKKDELIIYEDSFCRIFLNKEKLEQYYYYQKNKFPVKDSTGVLDMSITEDDIHSYLLVSITLYLKKLLKEMLHMTWMRRLVFRLISL